MASELSKEQASKSASAKRKYFTATTDSTSLNKSSSVPEPQLRASKRRKPYPDTGVRPDILKFPSGDVYTGATRDRKPHGYGKMTFEADEADEEARAAHTDEPNDFNTCFYWEGEWDTGKKHGRGHFCFPDGSIQSGVWVDDELEGEGEYTMVAAMDDANKTTPSPSPSPASSPSLSPASSPSPSYPLKSSSSMSSSATSLSSPSSLREEVVVKKIVNTYRRGEVVNASVGREYVGTVIRSTAVSPSLHDAQIQKCLYLTFEGKFSSDGCRHGAGTSYLWSTDDHSTHRPEAKLLHPTLGPSAGQPGCHYRVLDGRVEGEWEDGLLHGSDVKWFYPDGRSMLRGKWTSGQMKSARYFPSKDKAAPSASPHVFQSDFATTKKLSSEPTLRDPYESACVAVGPSRVAHPSANEGLFARVNLPAGRVVSWYNGMKVPCKEVDARPDWTLNDNVLNIDECWAIDIPPSYASTAAYCASVGHKANHASPPDNNAEYSPVFHPRFGDIKGIRLIRSIIAGEEILVDYGYFDEAPPWYSMSGNAKSTDSSTL